MRFKRTVVMASRTAAALQQTVRSVAKADPAVATDRDLLRHFVDDNDQAAFAALVGRHSSMVLGVCRRLLSTVQDAEDACQAVFLILAQKAPGAHWQSSLANWLYTTARKVANNARVAAQRRAKRERRAAVPESLPPVDRMTGRELLTALDAELEQLPPRYREPLVLCYLEGLPGDEAATRLAIPLATLHTRLDRGRKKLHDALTKGGVALGAGLLALAVTSPAGASPPRLVHAILAAASGAPSAAVAELVKGVAVNGFLKKTVLALAAAVGVAALGIGLGSLTSNAAGQKPDQSPRQVAEEMTLSGRVLGPDGKPLAGAKLNLLGKGDDPATLGTTGADGRFKVSVPADRKALYLVARAEGVGIDFVPLSGIDPAAEVELRLVKEQPIRGRVVDPQGQSVAGAKVVAARVNVYKDDSLDAFLAEWKTRELSAGLNPVQVGANPPRPVTPIKVAARDTGVVAAAITDTDGRFHVLGMGAESLVTLRIRREGLAEMELLVVNRDGFDPKPYNQATTEKVNVPAAWKRLLHGPELTVVAENEKPIRGVVKDIVTGKPRPGIAVWLLREGREVPLTPLTATTDAEGRYEIRGARKASAYGLGVESDPVSGHMTAGVRVADTAGYEPLTANIEVKKGVVITGKVIDAVTKKPLRGFAIAGILSDNPFVKEYPMFDMGSALRTGETGEDGTFRVVTLPGPVLLMGGVRGDADTLSRYQGATADPKYPKYFGGYKKQLYFGPANYHGGIQGHFCKVLDLKPDVEVVTRDVLVEPAP